MKPETRALLDKARASQRAAALLENEGYYDFAASRAYYAMFYMAWRFAWRAMAIVNPSPSTRPARTLASNGQQTIASKMTHSSFSINLDE